VVPIHFKPLLGIVTRKDFYFYYFYLITLRAHSIANMSSSHSIKDGALRLRPLEPLTMDDWTFHHRVVMRTLAIYQQAFKEDRPAHDAAKLQGILGAEPEQASSRQVAKAQAYLALIRKKKRVWYRHNDRAYAYLLGACDSQQSPMEVVYAHAAAVAALPEGAPGAGQDPTASKLLAALVARFSQAKNLVSSNECLVVSTLVVV
jgi:hypothetical protein